MTGGRGRVVGLAIAGLVSGAMLVASLPPASAGPAYPPTTDAHDGSEALAPLSPVAQIGKRMFFDPALSGSGKMSCASCHDPANHYAPANDLAVQLGGAGLDLPGIRAVPTLTYKARTPFFSIGPADADGDSIVQGQLVGTPSAAGKSASSAPDLVPQGGLFWDGRANTLEEQPLGPLLSPFEMANSSADALFAKLKTRPYAKTLVQLFGPRMLEDREFMITEADYALAAYQKEEPSFHPFTSKYDYYLAGEAELTPAEMRGLKLFDDPQKGNCAACHLDKPDAAGNPPLFTDFEFEALAVPRNPAIPANADPTWFDLGICGPMRTDRYAGQAANCGLFKTPTLRNVASRHVFFHNGFYDNLTDVVRFYVERDTEPAKIYPRAEDGLVEQYDDLPARYRKNVDVIDAPFGGKAGDRPALSDAEIADVVAFLKTLTDGYRP